MYSFLIDLKTISLIRIQEAVAFHGDTFPAVGPFSRAYRLLTVEHCVELYFEVEGCNIAPNDKLVAIGM